MSPNITGIHIPPHPLMLICRMANFLTAWREMRGNALWDLVKWAALTLVGVGAVTLGGFWTWLGSHSISETVVLAMAFLVCAVWIGNGMVWFINNKARNQSTPALLQSISSAPVIVFCRPLDLAEENHITWWHIPVVAHETLERSEVQLIRLHVDPDHELAVINLRWSTRTGPEPILTLDPGRRVNVPLAFRDEADQDDRAFLCDDQFWSYLQFRSFASFPKPPNTAISFPDFPTPEPFELNPGKNGPFQIRVLTAGKEYHSGEFEIDVPQDKGSNGKFHIRTT